MVLFPFCGNTNNPSIYENIIFSQAQIGGPTIGWDPIWNNTIAEDGTYSGQTEEHFDWTVWVNDSDGIDNVLFRFNWAGTDYWINRTTVRIEGNVTYGRYLGNLTWPAPKTGTFHLKFFANDTLGNWSESPNMTVDFGYLVWRPYDLTSIGIIVVSGVAIICIPIIVIRKYRSGKVTNPATDGL